jgi:hypothetical protein
MDIRNSQVKSLNELFNEEVDVTSNSSTRKVIEWSYENEDILAEWCDIAQCYKWLNTETYKYYKDVTSSLTIPCIIFSTISGTASFGIPNVPLEYQHIIPMIIGSITISVGIITTVQQYYRFAELKETHRILAIAWDKLARNIRIELAKAPLERIDARHFIKFTRIEFDRLMENSEIIPDNIVKKFNEKIKTDKQKDDIEANLHIDFKKALRKPDICDTIVSINEKRRVWFPQPISFDEEMSFHRPRSKTTRRRRKRRCSNNESHSDDDRYNFSAQTSQKVTQPPSPMSPDITNIPFNSYKSFHKYNILNPNYIRPSTPPVPPTSPATTTIERDIIDDSYIITDDCPL